MVRSRESAFRWCTDKDMGHQNMPTILLMIWGILGAHAAWKAGVLENTDIEPIPTNAWICYQDTEVEMACRFPGLLSNASRRQLEKYILHQLPVSQRAAYEESRLIKCTKGPQEQQVHFCHDSSVDTKISCTPQFGEMSQGSDMIHEEVCNILWIFMITWGEGTPLHFQFFMASAKKRRPTDELALVLISSKGQEYPRTMTNWQRFNGLMDVTKIHTVGPPDWIMSIQEKYCRYGQYHIPFNSIGYDLVGSHVIKLNHPQQLLIKPGTALKEVVVSFEKLNIAKEFPVCASYLEMSNKGWDNWVKLWEGENGKRNKQDLSGWLGTGAAFLDATNIEILANKLHYTTEEISKMTEPINTALEKITETPQIIKIK
ncbi:uncharacterized protein LOC133370410 [Rhineura floridana]|uniref:uncharacterized protein LOC133370410 n=1 Tax=Rhineura floridana TaxID=261503 RepID=UPI002AC8788B|nr:uncharacterized protein LOC133370410 [Rhineura floridana]